MNGDLTVVSWNTWWATKRTDRGRRVAAFLNAALADVIVVTEGVHETLPPGGNSVDAGSDWGGPSEPFRRKVIVWSRFPLRVDRVGEFGATRGRLVVAMADTPGGPVRVIGVCIPWDGAKVGSGEAKWSQHLQYLDQLADLRATLGDDVPTIVAGDFNQKIPRVRQPIRVAARLAEVFDGWTVHTVGDPENGPHIDHIASSDHLRRVSVGDWSRDDPAGRLSDHTGVSCRLARVEEFRP